MQEYENSYRRTLCYFHSIVLSQGKILKFEFKLQLQLKQVWAYVKCVTRPWEPTMGLK